MRAFVTGCAGFIGSTLSNQLLDDGWDVVGLDAITPYYSVTEKRSNLRGLMRRSGFAFTCARLEDTSLSELLDGVDVVFHQAAQPGVRSSWTDFSEYTTSNIVATHALLQACVGHRTISRFVYASSSSIYGDQTLYPTVETASTQPRSPYGVTKLAAEQLVTAYGHSWQIPTISLRYFTVYGPRQRPDMAIRRLLENAHNGTEFTLFGDGTQIRDFTFVDDVVAANILAATSADIESGSQYNVCGGSQVSMLDLFSLVEEVSGRPLAIERLPGHAGDVFRTGGSSVKAETELGWKPTTDLHDGISHAYAWVSEQRT
jgi:UDP-glucuronate 4-epimerase